MSTDDTNAARRGSESNDLLGPLPEPDVTALSDYFDAAGQRQSLAYSVDAVRALLAAERERWKAVLVQIRDDSWPDPDISAAEYACEVLNCGPNAKLKDGQ